MAARLLHHVEIGVKNGFETVKKLVSGYNLRTIAHRESDLVFQWVLAGGTVRFLITQLKNERNLDDLRKSTVTDNYATDWTRFSSTINSNSECKCVKKLPNYKVPLFDSVFNVALEVKDVEKCVDRVNNFGGDVIRKTESVEDKYGSVTYATVKSCLGNIHHTLINSEKYNGIFLPGFSEISPSINTSIDCDKSVENKNIKNNEFNNSNSKNCDKESDKDIFQHVDHLTFACQRGVSKHVLNWYANALGMERFKLNRYENEEDGFVIRGTNTGMKLFAMDYWKCAEEGISFSDGESTKDSLKFAIAEALDGQGSNQVETFIDSHGGPGVQHIGLYTDQMVEAVKICSENGAEFLIPPPTYYTLVGKKGEIDLVGEDLDQLQKLGILLDAEADARDDSDKHRYLMQVFTKPIFDRDTFFLEIINRKGASGFGAGNISALWNSVEEFLNSKKSNSNQKL